MAADPFRTDFDAVQAEGEPAFTVDLDGFEGPLDLLLELARRQRVDLARISILALAEQYLLFIEAARKLRLELAADYLVMAAWLAYLKSRLLLPSPPQAAEDADAPALAEGLAQRLRALAAIRQAGEHLMSRPRLGRDFFARGEPEAAEASGRVSYHANLYDLLAAYARQTQRHALARVKLRTREVWSLADARAALARLVGGEVHWTAFEDFLLEACADLAMRRSARASTFAASLELAREGRVEIRQEKAFAPIFIRPRGADPADERAA